MTSKIASKAMVSGGILKGSTIIRECNTKKNVTGISQRQTTKKKPFKRVEFLEKIQKIEATFSNRIHTF